MSGKPTTVEEYIALQSDIAQQRLNEIRQYLFLADPTASEELKWGKPAFISDGILYIYAAYKNHISLHPTASVVSYFADELSQYKISDNTIQFPLDNSLPKELIINIAKHRVFEKTEKGIKWK